MWIYIAKIVKNISIPVLGLVFWGGLFVHVNAQHCKQAQFFRIRVTMSSVGRSLTFFTSRVLFLRRNSFLHSIKYPPHHGKVKNNEHCARRQRKKKKRKRILYNLGEMITSSSWNVSILFEFYSLAGGHTTLIKAQVKFSIGHSKLAIPWKSGNSFSQFPVTNC